MVIKQVFLVLALTAGLALSGCSRQQSDWEKTRAANTTDAYELFLKKYPSGEFSAQAQARVKELYEERDWQKARDTDTLDAYQAFLKQYPEGKWTEEARIRVENFTLASAPPNAAPAGTEAAPAQTSPQTAAAARSTAKTGCGNGNEARAVESTCGCARLRANRRAPSAYNWAHSSPVPTRRTSAGQNSIRNIRNCCRDCRPPSRRRKVRPAPCIDCRLRI